MPGRLKWSQFVVARAARQMADRVNSGKPLNNKERENAFATFEALADYIGTLTPSEYGAILPDLAPIQKALNILEEINK